MKKRRLMTFQFQVQQVSLRSVVSGELGLASAGEKIAG
jgi:hypothetical protein